MPGFCRPRRPPDRRAGQRTLANRPVGTGAPAPPRRAIRACALRASADGPRLRTRFPASAAGSRPPAPNPPALRRARLRAPPPGDSRPRPSSIRRRPPPAHPIPASAGGSRPPAPNPPALRRSRLRAPPPGDSRPRPSSIRRRPRLRARFPASAGGSRPPAPNPPALRRTRLRAPPPDDSRPRPSSIRRRPPPAHPILRIGCRFAPARPESSRASANPPARPAAGRFAPARRGPPQAAIMPAPNPPTLRRPRLRAPPGDSRLRAADPRKWRSRPPRGAGARGRRKRDIGAGRRCGAQRAGVRPDCTCAAGDGPAARLRGVANRAKPLRLIRRMCGDALARA